MRGRDGGISGGVAALGVDVGDCDFDLCRL